LLRDKIEYEEAINLKISFYDRKIKELLENIERKDQVIDKLKHNRADLEDKLKLF
jgi:prefoldin subunit 5